jgi:hypothetical protein
MVISSLVGHPLHNILKIIYKNKLLIFFFIEMQKKLQLLKIVAMNHH